MLLSAALIFAATASPAEAGHHKAKTTKSKKAKTKKKVKAKKIKVVNYVLSGGLTAASTTVGQPISVVGMITPRARRPIRIEFQKGGAWVAGPSTVTSISTGAYRFAVPTGVTGQTVMRVVAPAKPKLKLKALSTAALTLSVVAKPVPTVVTPDPAVLLSPTGPLGDPPAPVPGGTASFAAVYAYPVDQAPDAGRLQAIQHDLEETNRWFGSQTTGFVQPRWARDSSGDIAVSLFPLPHATASYAQGDPFKSVVNDILATVTADPSQHPVVFVNANAGGLCGQTGRGFSVLFTGSPCPTPALEDAFPGGESFMAAHEITHAFGAVNQCAPNDDGTGHVRDDPSDILTPGSASAAFTTVTLDTNHKDYYETGRADCPGIESSPFWTLTSSPLS